MYIQDYAEIFNQIYNIYKMYLWIYQGGRFSLSLELPVICGTEDISLYLFFRN